MLFGIEGSGALEYFFTVCVAEGEGGRVCFAWLFLSSSSTWSKGKSLNLTLPTPLRREISARIGAMNQEVTAPALPLGALHRHNRPLPRTLDFYNTSSSYDVHSAVCLGWDGRRRGGSGAASTRLIW